MKREDQMRKKKEEKRTHGPKYKVERIEKNKDEERWLH